MDNNLDPYPGTLRNHTVNPPGGKDDNAWRAAMALRTPDDLIDQLAQARTRMGELMDENEFLRKDRLTNEVFAALATWLRHKPHKPAATAFTAGLTRQIAYALELDVLPEVRRLHQREQALMETVTRLVKAGNMLHDHVAHRHKESSEAWRGEVKHAEEHGHVTSY